MRRVGLGSGRRWGRRRRFFGLLVIGTLLAALVVWRASGGSAPDRRPPAAVAPAELLQRKAPLLGVLGFSGNDISQEQAATVGAATVSVFWAKAEPSPGQFDPVYLRSVNALIHQATAAGFSVLIDPGLQYPPPWVFNLAGGTRFVDQYGDVFSGSASSGNQVANAVTDPAVRTALGGYLAWLGDHLDMAEVLGVRQGGGPLGELRYPDAAYDGHTNCYWAYDASSQALASVLAYRPGTGTPPEAEAFLHQYNEDLIAFADWENSQYQKDFRRVTLLLLPGWGERPGVAAAEEAGLLTLNYPEFNQGLDWGDLLAALPDRADSVAYTTYLDAPSFGSSPQSEDPADFLASLADPLKLRMGGENTGSDDLAALNLTLQRAQAHRMVVVNWFNEQELAAAAQAHGAGPTFTELGEAARRLL